MIVQTNQLDFSGVDFLKAIMAICVVAIHTHPIPVLASSAWNSICNTFLQHAVPFFFITSGFLLHLKIKKKRDNKFEILVEFLQKNIKLYLIWTIIYLPLTIYGLYIEGNLSLYGLVIFFRNLLIVGENYFSWPLWYLLSLVFFALTLVIGEKLRLNNSILFLFFLCLYIAQTTKVGEWILEYGNLIVNQIYAQSFGVSRIFSGFIFAACGYFAGSLLLKYANSWSFLIFFTLLILLSIEYSRLNPYLIILSSLFLFSASLKIRPSILFEPLKLRKFSTVTYFTHMYFCFIILLLFPTFSNQSIILFLVTLVCCVLFTAVIIRYQDRLKVLKLIF